MNHIVDTIVVGAGHAGLATSRLLTAAGREHVVLDSGRVGERWRSERWDSLHLLTPSWMTRLPGWCYSGPEPDGYLSAAQFIDSLERYAASFGAPVVGGTTVRALTTAGHSGYEVRTDDGSWHARHVVLATGPHGRPRIPAGLLADGARDSPEQPVPQPVVTSRRRGARHRRVRVRCPDRRRARPGRPARGARRRPAHPAASALSRDGHLLVAGTDRPARPHHRRNAGPRGRASRAVVAAGRAGPAPTEPARTSTSVASSAVESSSPAGSRESPAGSRRLPTT